MINEIENKIGKTKKKFQIIYRENVFAKKKGMQKIGILSLKTDIEDE